MPKDDIEQAIAMRLVEARNAAGLTQAAAAAKLEMSQPALAHWEAGNRSIRLADVPKIATAYETTPQKLLKKIFGNTKNKA